MECRTTKLFLDRIEGGFGVVVGNDGLTIDLPLGLFPESVGEGTHVSLTIEVDEEATRSGKEQVASLMDELLREGNR